MHGQENEHEQSINLTLNDGDEIGDGREGSARQSFGRPGQQPPPISRR